MPLLTINVLGGHLYVCLAGDMSGGCLRLLCLPRLRLGFPLGLGRREDSDLLLVACLHAVAEVVITAALWAEAHQCLPSVYE